MICTAALVGFCLTAQISAPSETDRLKAEVQQLVEELDDSARSTRERAEKQLVKKGPNVLTLLPRTTDKTCLLYTSDAADE